MHRASTRQADLDARILRQRRIGRLLLGAPETYTALADRPGRALLGGAVASLVILMVVGVVAAAGSARTARRADGKARQPPGAAVASAAASPTTAAPGTDAGRATGAGAGQGAGAIPGADPDATAGPAPSDQGPGGQDPDAAGQASGGLPTVVSVGPSAGPACLVGEDGIEVVPLFTEDGLLRRVELSGFAEGCVGRDVRVAALGSDGAELDSHAFVLDGAGPLSVSWRERPLRRDALGRIVVEVR